MATIGTDTMQEMHNLMNYADSSSMICKNGRQFLKTVLHNLQDSRLFKKQQNNTAFRD